MAKREKTKGQTMVDMTLHRILKPSRTKNSQWVLGGVKGNHTGTLVYLDCFLCPMLSEAM